MGANIRVRTEKKGNQRSSLATAIRSQHLSIRASTCYSANHRNAHRFQIAHDMYPAWSWLRIPSLTFSLRFYHITPERNHRRRNRKQIRSYSLVAGRYPGGSIVASLDLVSLTRVSVVSSLRLSFLLAAFPFASSTLQLLPTEHKNSSICAASSWKACSNRSAYSCHTAEAPARLFLKDFDKRTATPGTTTGEFYVT